MAACCLEDGSVTSRRLAPGSIVLEQVMPTNTLSGKVISGEVTPDKVFAPISRWISPPGTLAPAVGGPPTAAPILQTNGAADPIKVAITALDVGTLDMETGELTLSEPGLFRFTFAGNFAFQSSDAASRTNTQRVTYPPYTTTESTPGFPVPWTAQPPSMNSFFKVHYLEVLPATAPYFGKGMVVTPSFVVAYIQGPQPNWSWLGGADGAGMVLTVEQLSKAPPPVIWELEKYKRLIPS